MTENTSSQFESILIDALEAMGQGRSVEQVLEVHPWAVDRLRPILETSALLEGWGQLQPSEVAERRSLRAFTGQAARLKRAAQTRSPWLAAAVAVATLVLGGTLMLALSQQALPGQALYPLKLNLEQAQRNLAAGESLQELTRKQEERRLAEVLALLSKEQTGVPVTLSGLVQNYSAQGFTLSGVPVQLGDGADVSGVLSSGAFVQIEGVTTRSAVLARLVNVLTPGPTATPAPPATPTPQPAPTATLAPLIPPSQPTNNSTDSQPASVPAPTQNLESAPLPDPDPDEDDDQGDDDDDAPEAPPSPADDDDRDYDNNDDSDDDNDDSDEDDDGGGDDD